jgi:hypothetical protein
MSNHESNFGSGEAGDPTLPPIQQLIETMGGTPAVQNAEPIVFETAEGAVTLEDRIREIIAQIEAANAAETADDAEANTAETQPPKPTWDYRKLNDYDIIDLDAVPDSLNALYVATPDDLRAILCGAYEALGFTEDMFAQLGFSREQFIDGIVGHEESHAKYARRTGRHDIRYSMLIKPAQDLDMLTGKPTEGLTGYEPVVQVDLGGQITKLEYAAIVVGADPSPEDRANIRRVFGYSSVREVIARMQHHNYADASPHLPLPQWYEDWQRSA